ncbi:DUF1214 domain-containing protein [Streptosporangium saharense]|uniref:DUF1214 domain-containing protein n=1 Tax=Streptosporangium saharense TaxID=1706840 RepID=UPI00369593F9
MNDLDYNADGSVTIHTGPRPPEGARNWLRTVPGRGWFGMFRNAYRPGDFVKAGSRT